MILLFLFIKNRLTFFRFGKNIQNRKREIITQALDLLELKKGDNVIIPAYVCSRLAKGVLASGAELLAADINRDDYNISYEDTVRKMSGRTKAIILPSMFGNPVRDIKDFLKTGVVIIEDIAQSFGAEFQGEKLGALGDMAVCSFYATKVITTGEGGALIINNGKLIKKSNDQESFFKMSDFQSALGRSQLKKIGKLIKRRKYIAGQYIKALEKFSNIKIMEPKDSIYYRFIIEAEGNPDKIIKALDTMGIKASRFMDIALNFMKLNV